MAQQSITKKELSTLRDDIRLDLRDLRKHVDGRFSELVSRFDGVDRRFDVVETELAAIKEMLTFRKEFENLIRELKLKGIGLDETKIFIQS